MKLDLLITGVGGQGVILASDIIGEAAIAAGYDAKKTDTLGMAQRGGSVISHVRLAEKVWSPLIKEGEVDIMLAFEKLESARWGYFLKPGGVAIINNLAIPPLAVNLGYETYPPDEDIVKALKQYTDQVYLFDGTERAKGVGDIKTLNIFMLGCVSVFADLIEVDVWKDCVRQRLPAKVHEMNLAAFELGRKEIRNARV